MFGQAVWRNRPQSPGASRGWSAWTHQTSQALDLVPSNAPGKFHRLKSRHNALLSAWRFSISPLSTCWIFASSELLAGYPVPLRTCWGCLNLIQHSDVRSEGRGSPGQCQRVQKSQEHLHAVAKPNASFAQRAKPAHSCLRPPFPSTAMLLDVTTQIGRDAPPPTCRIAVQAKWTESRQQRSVSRVR